MAKKIKPQHFHGEVTEVGEGFVTVDGRVLGRGGPKANPQQQNSFGVSENTAVEVNGVSASLADVTPGMVGIVRSILDESGSRQATLVSVEDELDEGDEDELDEDEVA